jgi:hypothetical protein
MIDFSQSRASIADRAFDGVLGAIFSLVMALPAMDASTPLSLMALRPITRQSGLVMQNTACAIIATGPEADRDPNEPRPQ